MDILLVEDDKDLQMMAKKYLDNAGFSTKIVSNGEDALEYIKDHDIKLLILDIMLPGIDGYTICEEVRERSNIPIIIVSAKNYEEDKILGLELGADDYIVKPYALNELVARVKANMRRNYEMADKREKIEEGSLTLLTQSRQVFLGKKELQLATKEFDLLKLLIDNKGKILKKEIIFNKIWGMESDSELSTLTVHINKLREKIEKNPKKPISIITKWGIGYRFEGID
ncbi:MAG: response regulator transcription factor [Spirochaetaceae bacterium]